MDRSLTTQAVSQKCQDFLQRSVTSQTPWMQSETQQRLLQRVMQSVQQVLQLWFFLQSIQDRSARSFILTFQIQWFWQVSLSAVCSLIITAHSLWRLLERQQAALLMKSEDSSGRSPALWNIRQSRNMASALILS